MRVKQIAFILWLILISSVLATAQEQSKPAEQEKPAKQETELVSKQCKGITKSKGIQCKLNTKNESGFCHMHKAQSPTYKLPLKSDYVGQCTSLTVAGKQCRRTAKENYKMCWQHL